MKGETMMEPRGGPELKPEPEPATIVFCIERGRLEQETLSMLESLRRWGGVLGQSRVLAVVPRRGAALREETLAAFKSFGVELHDVSAENPMSWYSYYNKVMAVRLADRIATTPVVIWLDCDIVVLRPLHELGLPYGDDFTARREPTGYHVTEEGVGKHIGYWRRACEAVGVSWDEVPWCLTDGDWPRQKLVFNAGIFAYRRGKGFVEAYDDFTRRLIRSGVALRGDQFVLNEQNALGLAMQKLGLRFRELSQLENDLICHRIHADRPSVESAVRSSARLVHYSHSRWPKYWAQLVARFEKEFPDHADWLRSKGPLAPSEGRSRRPTALGRSIYRKLRMELQRRRCARASAAWDAANGGGLATPGRTCE